MVPVLTRMSGDSKTVGARYVLFIWFILPMEQNDSSMSGKHCVASWALYKPGCHSGKGRLIALSICQRP